MKAKMPKTMVNGMAILNDFDKKIYTSSPAARQKMAVRVPDWNMPHITAMAIIPKNSLNLLILLVMAKMIKAADDAAA